MSHQLTFADSEFSTKRRQTRKGDGHRPGADADDNGHQERRRQHQTELSPSESTKDYYQIDLKFFSLFDPPLLLLIKDISNFDAQFIFFYIDVGHAQ